MTTWPRSRHGGRPFRIIPAKRRLAMAAVGKPETRVRALCAGLDTRRTLCHHVGPQGELRPDGGKRLAARRGP